MNYSESKSFFEISSGPQFDNTLEARFLCLKDFLKRVILFPLALVSKVYKTIFRAVGVGFGILFVALTLGCSSKSREFFVTRVSHLAKDLADWLLLPFAIVSCLLRLVLAFLIHPHFYFNSIV